ncbi:hypothetical protein [Halopseudomonas oceani]|uniref:hypothetical protein n=1 Tax=Halopseudomonas oceani TaxID=1708783 RepID=UPI002AA64FA1|nr:hypothetical protein [Halopseudomonas oceani]
MKKVTIYIDHLDDDADFVFMKKWLAKWEVEVTIADYSTGGWEHCWDLEAPEEAIQEIPEDWLCASDWATPKIFDKK